MNSWNGVFARVRGLSIVFGRVVVAGRSAVVFSGLSAPVNYVWTMCCCERACLVFLM